MNVIGVHEGIERLQRVRGFHAHRLADAVDALAGGFAARRLHLVAPERPVVLPFGRDVALLETGFLQHVLPDLHMHALLLQRKAVIALLLGHAVLEIGGLERVRRELRFDRHQNVGQILEFAFEGPFASGLHIVGVGIGNIRHGAGIERRHRLRDHVLDRVLRQLDLGAGLLFEFLDDLEQRVVFGLVEALAPPDRNGVLRDGRMCRQQRCRCDSQKRDTSPNSHISLPAWCPALF